MKLLMTILVAAVVTGCASRGQVDDEVASDAAGTGTIHDPTYPGPGVHLGIGVGSWGGRSGGGVGIGLGF